jgi:CRISPR-associated protein Cas1
MTLLMILVRKAGWTSGMFNIPYLVDGVEFSKGRLREHECVFLNLKTLRFSRFSISINFLHHTCMQLLLDSNGLTLSKRNGSFHVSHKTHGRRLISPHRITSIAVVRDCLISTAALRLAAKHQIPVHFCTATGKAEASLYGAGYTNIATLRRQQVLWATASKSTDLVVQWFGLKTDHQVQHLQELKSINGETKAGTIAFLKKQYLKMQQLKDRPVDEVRGSLLGLEGSAANAYWKAVSGSLPVAWQFNGRSRRPAVDYFNCVLNYLYGMTYNLVENAIRGAGLDPYFGFFHVDGHQRPTLVYDMIESFRPWVDGFLTELILQQSIFVNTHFVEKKNGWWLSKIGRKHYIPLFNDFMAARIEWQNYQTTRKNHIHRFAGLLAKQLKEEA